MARIQAFFTSWSYTRLQDYRQCPLKAKLKHLDKIAEPKNDAMQRGIDIHNMAEKYIKGTLAKLPKELVLFKGEFDKLRKLYKQKLLGAKCEESWCFTNTWSTTVWNDWVGCWVRIKLDAGHFEEDGNIMVVTDWKTGKFRQEEVDAYLEQIELYCLAALLLHPHLKGAKARLCYTDHGVIYPVKEKQVLIPNTPVEIARLKKKWNGEVKGLLNARSFPAKPNNKCHWCFYRASNKANGGGQCKY